MKIEEVRPSFTVYLIASEISRLEGLADSLGLAGYMVASFTELTAAFSEVVSNPPHFVLFDFEENRFNLKKAIKQLGAQLPESHIFLVTPLAQREQAAPMLEQGVADMILTPLASHLELVRALDRAAERDYFMYMNERLIQEQQEREEPQTTIGPMPDGGASDLHLDFARRLFEQKVSDESTAVFMKSAADLLGNSPAVYFKYISTRRVLAATQSYNLDGTDISGVGVNFNEIRSTFRTTHLRDPMGLPELTAMMNEVFHVSEFFAFPIEALGEVLGLAVFLKPEPDPAALGTLRDWMTLHNRALTLIELEKRLHVLAVKDPATDLYTRQIFVEKVREEVSRARRTSLPISLVLIAVDQYGQLVSQAGQEEAQTLLKMVARIFEKHSRVNDIIGRTGADEFGIILPHTGRQGAMIKAERLRRIIESADFSRVVASFPQITISIGVSEYPTMVRDAEELYQSADEALYQVRGQGNKTCVAPTPEGFSPDFEVHEKGV